VVMLEGEDLGKHFLTKLVKLIVFRQGHQEYPKLASVYEEFDEWKKRKVCVTIVASGRK
jgi:hypothetical protein